MGIRDTFSQTARSISLRNQMVLFPFRTRITSLGEPLPTTSITVRNDRRIPNSRLFSLHSQPSPLNILLTHSLRPVRLQPMVMTTTILQAAPKTRKKAMHFGNGGSFKRIGHGLLGSHNHLILKMIKDFMLAFFAHILVNMSFAWLVWGLMHCSFLTSPSVFFNSHLVLTLVLPLGSLVGLYAGLGNFHCKSRCFTLLLVFYVLVVGPVVAYPWPLSSFPHFGSNLVCAQQLHRVLPGT